MSELHKTLIVNPDGDWAEFDELLNVGWKVQSSVLLDNGYEEYNLTHAPFKNDPVSVALKYTSPQPQSISEVFKALQLFVKCLVEGDFGPNREGMWEFNIAVNLEGASK